jgi:hypothetical protein
LILHIQPNLFGIESNGIETIPTGPKVIAPIGLLLQLPELVENPNGCSAFEGPNDVRYGTLWRNHDQEVDMVVLHIELHHFTREMFTKRLKASPDFLADVAGEDSEAVFGRPHDVVLAVPQGV